MKNGDYLLIIAPSEYPGKKYRGRYCYEHHYVYWKHTGLIPNKNQMIHHKNEDRYDNKFKNLELIYKKDHAQKHPQKIKESNMPTCAGCGIRFYNRNKNRKVFFHSRKCYIKNHHLSPGGTH